MTDVAIRSPATHAAPTDYTIPGAQELLPKSVAASMDGTAASTTWYPALQFVEPGGNVMVTAVSPTAFAAGASVDVSWFPHLAPQPVSTQFAGTIVDQFLVDSKTSTETSGSVVLTSGVTYLVTAQGTWSAWNAALEHGSPNADAIFPSALGGRVSTQVGIDTECAFAFHDTGSGFTLGHKTFWKFDTGSGLTYVTPQGGPYATPQPNYLYRYSVVGGGQVLKAQIGDIPGAFTDNYGKIQVTVYSTSGSGTGGGGGSLVPPDGSDHSILRVESGIPGWEARPNIVEADLSLSDNTTANSSTSQHGFLKKLDNNSAHFMDGTGAWSTPSGSGSSPLTTKGDLFGFDTANARIPVGSDGQVLTASSGASLGVAWAANVADWTVVTKTADESVASSATLQNDDELFFTATASAMYEIYLVIVYGSPAGAGTPDIKMAFGEDATARGVMTLIAYWSTANAANGSGFVGVGTDQTAIFGIGTATADRAAIISGFHLGNGGTFRFLWAQNTNNVNATIVRAGSVLRYRRVT